VATIFLIANGTSGGLQVLVAQLRLMGHRVLLDEESEVEHSGNDVVGQRDAVIARPAAFDATIVIWNESSVACASTVAKATEALRLGRLISVRVPGLPVDKMPEMFRHLPTMELSDTTGIAARVADLGLVDDAQCCLAEGAQRGLDPAPTSPVVPERIVANAAAAASAPRVEHAPHAQAGRAASSKEQKALEFEAGRLVHKIPQKMWVGVVETVEVRLGRATAEGFTLGLHGRGNLTIEDISIVETMSIRLRSSPDTFAIEPQSETTQLVTKDHVKGTAFGKQNFGRWVWRVTAKKRGTHQLTIQVSANLVSRGVQTTASLEDLAFTVSVSVRVGRASAKSLRRLTVATSGAIGGALLGAMTQELWWPKIKELLQSLGLVN